MSIKAAQIPDPISQAAITSIVESTGDVSVMWTEPHDGYQEITSYLIEIKASSGEWFQPTDYCQGTDPSLLSCDIPMLKLHTTPYDLVFEQLVEVRVQASNSYGSALLKSPVNT